jgi:hypothetical protein
MHSKTVIDLPHCSINAGTSMTNSGLASRLPSRSLRKVFAVRLCGNNEFQSSDNQRLVNVAAIPSLDKTCRHHLFVEYGAQLKKLDLPSTSCVAVSQRFEARVGDTLAFDFVVLLKSSGSFAVDRPAVRAVLVNHSAESAVSLLDRSIDGSGDARPLRVGSGFRESQSFTVPNAGDYELRFISFVDSAQRGSEVHLLVDAVRVIGPEGQELNQLASLSCVGCVRRYMPN